MEKHEWIVLGENNGKINLVSKSDVPALLPKGSFLTVEEDGKKFVLRVDDSQQSEPYSPNPMIADMDLEPLQQDRKCQNVMSAFRVKDIPPRDDGYIDYIKPQSIARRSSQEEVTKALGDHDSGPRVFLASIYASQNQILTDNEGEPLFAKIPHDAFYHQTMISGKTGSGKTVATKYLAQYFVEELGGAVLALNVKEQDFLKMDKSSEPPTEEVKMEWDSLGEEPRGINDFRVYYPANTSIARNENVNRGLAKSITLSVDEIEPESLTGLLQGITDTAARQLPDIFRYWKEEEMAEGDTFSSFVEYFRERSDDREFYIYNTRGERSITSLHPSTYDSVMESLNSAMEFFDNEGARALDYRDILDEGKMSVIDVTGDKGIKFGSIILRDLLRRIVDAKSENKSEVPILIIIDEVHQFYDTSTSTEALDDLARICRTGRSQEIGVVFSSQNPSDIPKGLSSVINTKIFFKSDAKEARDFGIKVSPEEMENLGKGYAVASIHNLSQLKMLKFPLAYSGVLD